ncbi:NfeD family protein [Cohnella faecalis]|uniref:NfeD family protein n=1 Tax=Cohnella faecalis TaxID=2315694 RepID=A0A398CJA3_9BACL|nr:NfeD family protein [Cohnella faecalis]RIE00908.1 NfeD family protein [Cohnella faecalis]
MDGWVIWFIAAGVLLVIEMFTLTFYLLWLGIGALVAAVVGLLFPDSLVIQIIAGAVASLLLTIYTKPLTRKFRSGRGYRDAIDELVGKEGIIVDPVVIGRTGIVKVGNETWSATADEPLQAGETVTVIHRGTTVLEVRKKGG